MACITIGRDPQTGKLKRAYFYGKTRQAAAEHLAKALRDKHQGVFVAPQKLTLGAWLDTWLWEYKKPELRPTTFAEYESMIRCHLKPALGQFLLKDLQPEHVQRFYNEKAHHGRIQGPGGLSAGTVHMLHTVLRSALQQAMKTQMLARNVSELTARPREARKEMRTLTLEQVAGQLFPTVQDERLYPAVFLAFATGLRRGELLALRWQDVDLDAAILHVR